MSKYIYIPEQNSHESEASRDWQAYEHPILKPSL